MKKRSYVCAVISLILSALAVYTFVSIFQHSGRFDLSFPLLAFLGFAGSLMIFFRKEKGKWMLVAFYALQTFEIFAGDFRFIMNVGFSFPIRSLHGGIEEALSNPVGWGVNLLAAAMLVFSFAVSKKDSHNHAIHSTETSSAE